MNHSSAGPPRSGNCLRCQGLNFIGHNSGRGYDTKVIIFSDCCDGSDEYESGVTCPNTCEELGRAAREEAKRREELISQGGKLRRALVDEGKQKVCTVDSDAVIAG